MRVTISNMAWLDKKDLSLTDIFLIKKNTTIIPKTTTYANEMVKPIEMFRETETHLGIPRHYYRKNNDKKNEVTYDLAEGKPLPKNVNSIALREFDQKPVMDLVYESLTCGHWGSGLLEAYTAFGKTVCAIDLICRLGGNAIILVHSDALLMQWKERIKEFFPNAKIGTIQQKTCEYKDKDIVIGMIQSLMRETDGKYPDEIYSYFRTMICDEIHRYGSSEFGKVAPKFSTKYSLGMSGTIRRADGCINVFKWVLGEIIVKADDKFRINPVIYVRYTPFRAVRKEWQQVNSKTGHLDDKIFDMNSFTKPTQLGFIARCKERNLFIAQDIVRALKSGRNPLVMGERKKIFYDVIELVKEMTEKDPFFKKTVSQGLYIGGKDKDTKRSELEAASRCDVVYATMQLAKEGIDIRRLDTLFLTTPLSDVEQVVGRICRPDIKFEDGKPIIVKKAHHAMVVDYCDEQLRSFEGLLMSRVKLYSRLNWKIVGLKELDREW